jgi:hypothetical protein
LAIQVIVAIFIVIGLSAYNWSTKDLVGTWQCSSIQDDFLTYGDTMTFNGNGTYTWVIGGSTTSGTYRLEKPSKYNEDIWASIKPTMEQYFDVTGTPTTNIIALDSRTVETIIMDTTSGYKVMFVYANGTYVCKNSAIDAI